MLRTWSFIPRLRPDDEVEVRVTSFPLHNLDDSITLQVGESGTRYAYTVLSPTEVKQLIDYLTEVLNVVSKGKNHAKQTKRKVQTTNT